MSEHLCAWCGRRIDSMVYVTIGHKFFCSERCYREWLKERDRWEGEGGMWHGD